MLMRLMNFSASGMRSKSIGKLLTKLLLGLPYTSKYKYYFEYIQIKALVNLFENDQYIM